MRDDKARDFYRGKEPYPEDIGAGDASRDVSRGFIGTAPPRAMLVRLADQQQPAIHPD